MELNLKLDQQYIVKNGIEYNAPIRGRGGIYEMLDPNVNADKISYQTGKLYSRAVITVVGIEHLNDLFARCIFKFSQRDELTQGVGIYQRVGLPHFLIYDDGKLQITDQIKESLFTSSYKNHMMSLTFFKESIIEYDPIIEHKIAMADAMIFNAGSVIAKNQKKIQKIYEDYFIKKKEYTQYDNILKTVVGSDVVEKQTHTDFFKESDSTVNDQQSQQPQNTDDGKEPQ